MKCLNNIHIRKYIQIGIGTFIILLLIEQFKHENVIAALYQTKLSYFLISTVFWLGVNIIMAYRIQFLTTELNGKKIPLKQMLFYNLGGMLLGDVSPGRTGYFGISGLLKKNQNIPLTTTFAILSNCQIVDLIIKIVFSIFAVTYIFSLSFNNNLFLISVLGISVMSFASLIGIVLIGSNRLLYASILNYIPYWVFIKQHIINMREDVRRILPHLFKIISLTLLGLLFCGFQWWLIGFSLGIQLSIFVYILIHPLATSLSFIPITPAGLGIQETGIVLILLVFGIAPETGLIFALLTRLSSILVDMMGFKVLLK